MIPIVPAFIPTSEQSVRDYLSLLNFSPEVHVDVVDGQFVPNTSWPYLPAGDPMSTRTLTDQFTLEIDLMVQDPLEAAVGWITAGADMLVFHLETVSLDNFKNFEDYTHVSIGICADARTPFEQLCEYATYADYIQIMGIETIGLQGQSFYEPALERIRAIKNEFPDKPITVDGSVNTETISKVVAAGADRVVVGSAIVLQPNPRAAYIDLQSLITNTI